MMRSPHATAVAPDSALATTEDADVEPDPRRTAPAHPIALECVATAGDWRAYEPIEDRLAALVDAMAQEIALPGPVEVAIALADDATVQRLNRDYRGQDKPTNVLSFPAAAAPGLATGMPRHLGDVVLAVETLDREAAALDISPAHHFQHLVLHGVLHLLGHDHETDADAARMESLEIATLARLGIANPYSVSESSP